MTTWLAQIMCKVVNLIMELLTTLITNGVSLLLLASLHREAMTDIRIQMKCSSAVQILASGFA